MLFESLFISNSEYIIRHPAEESSLWLFALCDDLDDDGNRVGVQGGGDEL